jgi:hypothetical protein
MVRKKNPGYEISGVSGDIVRMADAIGQAKAQTTRSAPRHR